MLSKVHEVIGDVEWAKNGQEKESESIGEKMWKVRAQFKWCADQNYGFEV